MLFFLSSGCSRKRWTQRSQGKPGRCRNSQAIGQSSHLSPYSTTYTKLSVIILPFVSVPQGPQGEPGPPGQQGTPGTQVRTAGSQNLYSATDGGESLSRELEEILCVLIFVYPLTVCVFDAGDARTSGSHRTSWRESKSCRLLLCNKIELPI